VTPAQPARMHEVMPAVPASTPRLRKAVARFAATAGADETALENVTLAVSEAVTNVILHAYADAEQPGLVHVSAAVEDDVLHVTVGDDGRGLVPRLDSPGLGLGLPLIGQTADTFDVQHAPSGGTELRMSFRLAG
jgi:serine/threonine-protein kinase RsbW